MSTVTFIVKNSWIFGLGAKVYMACRNMEKAEQARQDILRECPEAQLVLLKLDLSSLSVTEECAKSFLKGNSSVLHSALII